MMVAVLVVLAGLAVGVLGLMVPDLYVVGLLILIVGGVGVLVRFIDLLRILR